MNAYELRTPQERNRYGFALAFSIIAWILLVVSIVGAIYAAFIIPAVLIGHALFLAHIRGNGVRIGPDQLPELWNRVDAAAKKLGLETTPDTYVVQAGGLLNAFATKLFARKFVIIYSDLIDACEAANPSFDRSDATSTELDFVIAHELGHIACGHLTWALLPARVVPLLGPAYSRACEYTCDACGDSVVGDPEISMRALAILASGGSVGRRLNMTAFADQRKAAGKFWSAVYELNASHPYLCKRVAALSERHQPGSAKATGRNLFAYPLAPAFSVFTGGAAGTTLLVVIMIIFVMGAAAIPAYRNYLEKAKAAQTAFPNPGERLATDDAALKDKSTAAVDGFIVGETFPWRMGIPNPSWQVLPRAQSKRNNPLADGWLVRSDIDAHIMVIAEKVEGAHSLKEFIPIVIDNGKLAGSEYQLLDESPMSVAGGEGEMLHSKSRIGGYDMEFITAVRLSNEYLFQIVSFADSKVFPKVRSQFITAVESFEMLPETVPKE